MSPIELAKVSISKKDWSLDGQGSQDEARHNQKVKEAIAGNLDQVVSDGTIITADPSTKRVVKVPLRSIELPHIIYKNGSEGIGSGEGIGKGDVVDSRPGRPGDGQAGTEPGMESYDVEFSIEEIKEMVFADFGLPLLQPKQNQDMESDTLVFDETRKKRTPTNLDITRTIFENMRRNAQEKGQVVIAGVNPDDFRVRSWRNEIKDENAAVVISMADISGSMGTQEKYLTRIMNWWGVEFLRYKFPRVETVFIVHDTEASEVSEEDFFKRSDGGGTACSSAADLALGIISKRYPIDSFNIYLQHYSDGDNYDSDNQKYVDLINQTLALGINHFAYINIGKKESTLQKALNEGIKDDRFLSIGISHKDEAKGALGKIYDASKQIAAWSV